MREPTIDEIDRELAKRSLIGFTEVFWNVLEPATPFSPGWHLDAIAEHLEAVDSGEIRNLLINMPPRHMKSLAVSVFWPVRRWIARPESRWLFSSYALSLSIRDSLKCRRLIESPKFQRLFGDKFKLTGDQNAKMRFDNDRMGYRIATSVGGAATGEGGDVVVVDDPHNVQEKESDLIRESTLIWWDETMSTRLNDQRSGAKVIVMQRVHEKDLSGHVLKQGGYVHLMLPAEYEPGRKCITQIGWEDPRKTEGELLWPDRVGSKELAELKTRLGSSGYAGQFQQSPTPAGGGRFKQQWFRYFEIVGDVYKLYKPNGDLYKVVRCDECDSFGMMDPAGAEKEQNNKPCYTVLGAYDVTPDGDALKFDHYREQIDSPSVAELGVTVSRRHELPWIGVEKDGLGLGVVQTMRRRGVTVRGIKARGTKEARSETAEIRMEAGMVYFLKDAPWLFELEKELLLWPNSEYADQVDELSHAMKAVQQIRGAPIGEQDSFPTIYSAEIQAKEHRETELSTRESREQASRAAEMHAWINGDDD